jgi:hypothetical protein
MGIRVECDCLPIKLSGEFDIVARGIDATQAQAHVPLRARRDRHRLRRDLDQIGHADPGFTLRVYRHAMKRDQASKGRLRSSSELMERL